jgi:hypothetical protein
MNSTDKLDVVLLWVGRNHGRHDVPPCVHPLRGEHQRQLEQESMSYLVAGILGVSSARIEHSLKLTCMIYEMGSKKRVIFRSNDLT